MPCLVGYRELTTPSIEQLFFTHIVYFYRVPHFVLYDCNPRFPSAFWKTLIELLGNKVLFSSVFYPQIDDQTQRINNTIEQILCCISIDHDLLWLERLSSVEFAINNSV